MIVLLEDKLIIELDHLGNKFVTIHSQKLNKVK